MQTELLRELLEEVKSGTTPIDVAAEQLGAALVADLGYANVDLHRRQRCGFPEVIYCEGKTTAWVEGVIRKLVEPKQDSIATRVGHEMAEHLRQVFPLAKYDEVAR